ncbi:MAG TPA: aminoglycoside phosphotransferase family protein [Thermomicrobiales bacterium]|nr:aminoglycoside phosphotransferase family protein [Thermomicrobiales bacterium]
MTDAMLSPSEWPAAVRDAARTVTGPPVEVARLGGMGGGAVWRVRSEGATVVVKRGRRSVEAHVYTTLAETFEAHGIAIPRLHLSEGSWLVIEDIPRPLPRERWEADGELLATLRRLHSLPLDRSALPPDAFVPAWPESMSLATLSLCPEPERIDLAPLLQRARQEARPLFEPVCPISGDPNPLNWGLRDDGRLVLFDWERFTLGAPAIDLAITVPGLGAGAAYRRVATTYLGSGASPEEIDGLARSIRLAKVWSVVEFLHGVVSGSVKPGFSVDTLVEQVAAWLRSELFP